MTRALFAAAMATVALCAQAQDKASLDRLRCAEKDAGNHCTLYDASIVELIANPRLFDGKRVRTIGYIHFEFEGNGLYLHKEDYEHRIHANGVWVSFAGNLQVGKCQDRYALVEGAFKAGERGHMGLWSGTIADITRCMPWR